VTEYTVKRGLLAALLASVAVGAWSIVPDRGHSCETAAVHSVPAATELAGTARVTADFVDAPLADVAMVISEVTGQPHTWDGELEGEVTITSHEPITVAHLYELFLVSLDLHGYTAVRFSDATHILRASTQRGGPAGLVVAPTSATELDLRLLATAVAGRDGAALIASEGYADTARLYQTGDAIGGDTIVVRVRDSYVVLLTDGEYQYLAAESLTGSAEREQSRLEREQRRVEREQHRTKRAARLDTYRQDRAEAEVAEAPRSTVIVDKARAAEMIDLEIVAQQVRVIPHKTASGDVDGYRLSGIRRGSLFDALEFKNGDIINGVNGQPLHSSRDATGAYYSIRDSSRFEVELTRRGTKQILEFEIR